MAKLMSPTLGALKDVPQPMKRTLIWDTWELERDPVIAKRAKWMASHINGLSLKGAQDLATCTAIFLVELYPSDD